MNGESCKNCLYWFNIGETDTGLGDSGFCQRFPPQSNELGDQFPGTSEGMWCGEWKLDETLEALDRR